MRALLRLKPKKGYSRISVYAQTQELYAGEFIWDTASDFETGVVEAADTHYYIYVTEEGIPIISDERPYDRLSELRGFYHPYHSWRNVGLVFNDGAQDFDFIKPANENPKSPIISVDIAGNPQTIEFEDIFKKDHSYRIDFNNVEVSGSSTFLMNVGEAGNTFKTDGSYNYTAFGVGVAGTLVLEQNTVDTLFKLSCIDLDSGGISFSGSIWINNPRDATKLFKYYGMLSYRETGNHEVACTTAGEYRGSTVGIGSIKFDLSSTNTFDGGNISVYEHPIK